MAMWRTQHTPEALAPALRQWFQTPMGRTLLQEELPLIDNAFQDTATAGHRIIKLSVVPDRCRLPSQEGQRHFHLGSYEDYGFTQVLDAICEFDQLPVANETQDIVLLHHVLEFVENPHKVLREAERVIVPHGRVVICGINPYSALAMRAALGRLKRSATWQNHRLSINRLRDWLSLLGFEVEEVHYAFHRLPLQRPQFFMQHQKLRSALPMGGVFVLSATKYRAPLTPAVDGYGRRGQIIRHPAMLGATRDIES